jgi:hypothetical protein
VNVWLLTTAPCILRRWVLIIFLEENTHFPLRKGTKEHRLVSSKDIFILYYFFTMNNPFDNPVYMELDGEVASMIPNEDGGVHVTKTGGISIAEFMQDGTVITKEEYDKLDTIREKKYIASQK